MIIEQLTFQKEGREEKAAFSPPLCINRDLISDMDSMISWQKLMIELELD